MIKYKFFFLICLAFVQASLQNVVASTACISNVEQFTDSSVLYSRRPVSFKSGGHTLKGQLVVPKQVKSKVPAIVFCVGSSSSSTMAHYASFTAALLEQSLPMDSIAILYFDKRGVGESEGRWYTTDFEGRAADAKAAADYLLTLPFIDSDRIAIVGHSQGGWITQVCLSNYPDTFVGGISLAGPTFNVREQVQNDYASMLMCQEQLAEDAARQKALKMVNRDFFLASLLPVKENWKQLKVIKDFTPTSYLRSVNRPLLLVFGEHDALVSPKHAVAALHDLFPQGVPSNIQHVTIQGANHSFKMSDFCHKGTTKTLPYAEACRSAIRHWIRLHLFN
ncbi:hypothetical protein PKOR_15515 [Pontibacter korlensis]|uniref:Peptidase S9 prolyl oligopeptidase catalytic domain-containing protein n=1 Tax=Pontibacter korlensis TaxID=400092 RepID=A0A0E3UY87_9BACT|nr:alpha/beta fold hydrolase [Pontibacter korlensis]AKD04236.1 hypothetical protein PKOR_15515 [Pontibacter korlensis]